MSDGVEVRHIICQNGTGGCYFCCGFLATVNTKENRIIKIEPNPDHPMNRGWVCHDRVLIPDFHQKYVLSKWQLLHPLKRMGERGENKWQQISYEKALDEIADRLKEIVAKYGPESIGLIEGTFRSDTYWAKGRLMNQLGNPNNVVDPITVCGGARHHTRLTVGSPCSCGGRMQYGYSNIKCAVIAQNSAESFPLAFRSYMAGKEKGMKLIVFDPRCTETARNADYWLQIRPGTDGAALLAWINVIIKENLYDRDYVLQWTNAPFLVRTDRNRLLREKDLEDGGSVNRFVVWNETSKNTAIWNPDLYEYRPSDTQPALNGAFQVILANGEKVTCKTVWRMLAESVEKYTSEVVSKITWLDPELIAETARVYATSKPAAMNFFVSPHQIGRNASRVGQTEQTLTMITGNAPAVSHPGPIGPTGEIYVRESEMELSEAMPPEQRRKQLGFDKYKVETWASYNACDPLLRKVWGVARTMSTHAFCTPAPLLWRTILSGEPYPIKAVITWGANPMVWAANTKLVYKALKSPNIDLHVVVEHVMTPTADLADYVMPGASKSIETPFISNWQDGMADIICGEAAIKPLGERRSDYEFWRGLAIRMGYEKSFPWKDAEEVCNYRLKPLGLTLKEAAKKGMIFSEPCTQDAYKDINPKTGKPYGFATPTGKLEIWPAAFEEFGYEPLPFYEEPPESPISTPSVAREYPLILTTGGRFRPMFHSEYRQPGLGFREQHPDPLVDIHIDTARKYGIANGDWIWIETRRGRIKQRARVSAAEHPQVVNVEASWWYPEMPAEEPYLHGVWESNANVLTLDEPDALDPLTGGWCNRALLCKIYKASGP